MFAAVDKNGDLNLHYELPIRIDFEMWWDTTRSKEVIQIGSTSLFFEMIGRVLTWEDEPIELVIKEPKKIVPCLFCSSPSIPGKTHCKKCQVFRTL